MVIERVIRPCTVALIYCYASLIFLDDGNNIANFFFLLAKPKAISFTTAFHRLIGYSPILVCYTRKRYVTLKLLRVFSLACSWVW